MKRPSNADGLALPVDTGPVEETDDFVEHDDYEIVADEDMLNENASKPEVQEEQSPKKRVRGKSFLHAIACDEAQQKVKVARRV